MGTSNEKGMNSQRHIIPTKSSFHFESIIGRGSFGRVWRVVYKPTKQKMALKQISKAMIIENKTVQSYLNERNLLVHLNNNPFVVKIHFAFQDKYYLYIAMDLLTGGDLRFHFIQNTKFTEEQTKFFICSALLGLESLSQNNIIHRDIKPENLVLDDKGYLKITDFGIATTIDKASNKEITGTLGYMSPEVMLTRHYTAMTDYFALGVVAYELMIGKRPYEGATRNEIRRQIITRKIIITMKDIPKGWSIESADFINRLLQRTPDNRLGFRGISDIKNHSWLKYFDWSELYDQKMKAPFIPSSGINYDVKFCKKDVPLSKATKKNYEKWLKDPEYVDYFIQYNYSNQFNKDSAADADNNDAHIQTESTIRNDITNNDKIANRIYGHINPYISIKDCLNLKKEEKVVDINTPPENIDEMRLILRSSKKNVILINQPSADEDVNYNNALLKEPIVNVNVNVNVLHHQSPSTNYSTPQINDNSNANDHHLNKRVSWIGRNVDRQREARKILSKYYMNK